MSDDKQNRAAAVDGTRTRAEVDINAIGIDDAFISTLVDTFYARVMAHPELGAVFDAKLSGRWPGHMERMKRFWSAVAFRNGGYEGKPVQAHLGVANITPELFSTWLELFATTLSDIAPNKDVETWFTATAERIAKSLSLALFYNPALDDPKRKSL